MTLRALPMILIAACSETEPASTTTETGAPAATGCGEDTPLLTWDGFGQGFLLTHCQGCHAATTPNRNGAPAHVRFDTEADALQWKDRILATAGTEPYTMPPAGGPDASDRQRLVTWLTCWGE